MKFNNTLNLFISLFLLIVSCNNKDGIILKGEYSGIFTVEYTNGEKLSTPVSVDFNNNTYSSSTKGSGTFEINNNTITFQDENIWTADFDWNLILSGEYNLEVNSTQIKISSNKNDIGFYQYLLDKQK